MSLKRTSHTAHFAILFDAYKHRGGVIDFDFYDISPDPGDAYTHRKVARGLLDQAATASREFIQTIAATNPVSQILDYEWDESKLKGEQISFDRFWGTDDETRNGNPRGSRGIPPVDGFKTAFFYPPHGLSGTTESNQALFDEMCDDLFGNRNEWKDLSIWSWSTDCSTFFAAGHEWWGAFFWTVSRVSSTILVLNQA